LDPPSFPTRRSSDLDVSLGGDPRREIARPVSPPVRVAVVGAGAIAQVAHLPVLRKLPGVEVAAICDNDVSKAQALAARFDVKDADRKSTRLNSSHLV